MIADQVAPDDRVAAYALCVLVSAPVYLATYLSIIHWVRLPITGTCLRQHWGACLLRALA